MQLTAKQLAYLNELAADIAKQLPQVSASTMLQAATDAHQRRQKFAVEILAQRTRRSVMAKKALTGAVFIAGSTRAFKVNLHARCTDLNR